MQTPYILEVQGEGSHIYWTSFLRDGGRSIDALAGSGRSPMPIRGESHGEAEKAGCLRQEFHQALAAPRDVGREEMDGRLHRGREELDRLWAPAEQRQDHPENNAQTQSGQSNPLDSE